MTPRFESCYFGSRDSGDQFTRLARVLRYSAGRHCPDWRINIQEIEPEQWRSAFCEPSLAANTHKLTNWTSIVEKAPDGDRIVLADVDTMVLRPIDDAWSREFDIAYTTKTGSRLPFNAGVVFLRVSKRTRDFMRAWRDKNIRFIEYPEEHRQWKPKYSGINQAALGCLLEGGIVGRLGLNVAQLECREWNCEDESWDSFDPAVTRIVHVKSGLRRAVFGLSGVSLRLRPLVRVWRQLEREAAAVPAI